MKKNIIQMTCCVYKMASKCQKITKHNLQKTHVRLNLFLFKYFLDIYNFLNWYEILTTQTRLIWTTFPNCFIGNGHYTRRNKLFKFSIIQKCPDFELWMDLKHSKQLELTWKFTTITRLQGESNPTNFIFNKHWMKKIEAPKVVAIKM